MTEEKRRRGRPPGTGEKQRRFLVSLSDDELAFVEARATKGDRSRTAEVARIIRASMKRYAPRVA